MSGAPRRRILAVDFGDRRTGLAATDPTGTIATPLGALEGLDDRACARAVASTAQERNAEVIVVGVPLSARGEIGARARRTLEFVAILEKVAACPVDTIDESFTTDEAHRLLGAMKASQRKRFADSVAAVVILERYRGRG